MKKNDLRGRLERWAMKLQGYQLTIEHRKATENVVADAISRSFEGEVNVANSIGMPPYLAVFGQNMTTHGRDYQLLEKLGLMNEGSTTLNRIDQFSNIRGDIQKYMQKAYKTNKRTYDLRSHHRTFEIGQKVTKRNFKLSNAADNFNAKLAPVGVKVRVKKKCGQSLYLLEDLSEKELGTFHAKDIW
ncbi:hypothetical protein KR067_009352 [Drosophila pandora]|nr:hypothetical protein KR067_009352 [Drosophila pandora]